MSSGKLILAKNNFSCNTV